MFRAYGCFLVQSLCAALLSASQAEQKVQQQANVCLSFTSDARLHQKLYNKKPGFYAYIMGDVAGKKVDCHHAAQTYISPASCQKIITALLALRALGPEYRYQTQLFSYKQGNRIQNARIDFSGDPLLTSTQLKTLMQPLAGQHIHGRLFLDFSVFKTPEYSNDWMIGDMGSGYSGPVSGGNVDHNWIEVFIKPNHRKTNDKKTGVVVSNTVQHPMVARVIISDQPTEICFFWVNNVLHVEGHLNDKDLEKSYKVSPKIFDPYVLKKVRQFITALGITGQIEIIHDRQPLAFLKKGALISVVYSEKLEDFLPIAFKKSDNLVFDALYLTLLNEVEPNAVIEWSKGDVVIKGLLKKYFGLDMAGALFVDGSGLSRYNRIQPAQLWSVLKAGYAIPAFVNAFAYPGEKDSTLAKRITLPPSVRAKTGRLLGISSLSGYVLGDKKADKSGSTTKAFVFVAQGYGGGSTDVHAVMDDFLTYGSLQKKQHPR